MGKPQLDFTALFNESLGGSPEPIRYKLRDGPCLLHDIAFLNSLIHDARVLNPSADNKSGKISVQLNRDCWELGYTPKQNALELHIADSLLEFEGVDSTLWSFPNVSNTEPWIDCLWLDRTYRGHGTEQFRLFLFGHGWECDLTLNRNLWSVELLDQETPYLWSIRNPI